jgi:hypothetical protein
MSFQPDSYVSKVSKPTLNNFGRPVLVKDKDYKTNTPRERLATFHIWGYRRVGGRNAPPVFETVAIVELEDGRITSKHPDSIVFLKETKQVPVTTP